MVKLTNFHRENISKMLTKAGMEVDLVDIESIWDTTLTETENYNKIREVLEQLSVDKDLGKKYQKDEKEFLDQQMTLREEEQYKQEFAKKINEIKDSKIEELTQYYQSYYQHIDGFLVNKIVNGMVIVGSGGIGKSFNLMLKLKEKDIDFKLLKGHTTALSFYRFLYENRERQFIIIDDICKLIEDSDIISLLLGATDYDNRLVCWQSNSPLTSDLPKQFLFNSKIFILANRFDKNDEFLQALKDRCILYELDFSKAKILEMLYILAKKKKYPLELVDFIREYSESNIIENLSLRLLDKIHPYYNNGNDWKSLITEIMETDELKQIVFGLMKSDKTVESQEKEFTKITGRSRATFYRIKAKLKKSQSISPENV